MEVIVVILKNTEMLLFRYSNYKKLRFIDEHTKIIHSAGYVWMMKMGKKTSAEKIKNIIKNDGYIVFKSPIAEGNRFYIGRFIEFSETLPEDDDHMPSYYSEIVNDENFWEAPTQYFKLIDLVPLEEKYVSSLHLKINNKKVLDVINETRTAVMFIKNHVDIDVNLRNGEI